LTYYDLNFFIIKWSAALLPLFTSSHHIFATGYEHLVTTNQSRRSRHATGSKFNMRLPNITLPWAFNMQHLDPNVTLTATPDLNLASISDGHHLDANLSLAPAYHNVGFLGPWVIPIVVTVAGTIVGQLAGIPGHLPPKSKQPSTTVVKIWVGMTASLNDADLVSAGGDAPLVSLYDTRGELIAAGKALEHRKPIPEGSFRQYELKHLQDANSRQGAYIKIAAGRSHSDSQIRVTHSLRSLLFSH
jgi:hypothetical protein